MSNPLDVTGAISDRASEILLRLQAGEEWSLHSDDPQLDLRKQEWDHFNPAECWLADFRALLKPLEKSA